MLEGLLSLASFLSFFNQILPLFNDGVFGTTIAFSCSFLLTGYLLTVPIITTQLARFTIVFMGIVEYLIATYVVHQQHIMICHFISTIVGMIILVDSHIKYIEAVRLGHRNMEEFRHRFQFNTIMGRDFIN
jgi:hypothetical protein